jgi:peptide-methionine (S)-S-oxide reductase
MHAHTLTATSTASIYPAGFRSGIYFHTPEQKTSAEASRAAWNEKLGGQVVTEIEELRNFNMAEDYHQQYLEKGGQSARKSCNDPIRCYG